MAIRWSNIKKWLKKIFKYVIGCILYQMKYRIFSYYYDVFFYELNFWDKVETICMTLFLIFQAFLVLRFCNK